MIFHYVKTVVITSLLLLPLSSCANPVESGLNCTPLTSKVPSIAQLDKLLKRGAKEYFVHYQNNVSEWVFESYLFVGEVNGKYIIASAGDELPKSEVTISKNYFDELRSLVVESTNHRESSPITSEQGYCQYIGISGQRSIVLAEETSDAKLRKLRSKLDALIIYQKK